MARDHDRPQIRALGLARPRQSVAIAGQPLTKTGRLPLYRLRPIAASANNSLARNNKTLAGRFEENRQMGDDLILRLSASRLDGPDYYDVLCDGEVVGTIHLRPALTAFARSWRREG